VPASLLPEVADSAGEFGRTDPDVFLGIDAPITGIAGDQQAALFGQGCWAPGMSKNTYGTGSFLLLNTGSQAPDSEQGLLTSVAWQLDGKVTYALEGAIFVTGAAIQWLRDQLGLFSSAEESEALAAEVPAGNDGVYLVPAFVGLGAPHWDQYARGALVGLTRGSGRGHLARAAIEAMAYQTVDVADLMEREAKQDLQELRVDGGAVRALTERGSSLLAAGVVDARGDFRAGDAVDVIGPDERLVRLAAPSVRDVESERTVEGERLRHVGDSYANCCELRCCLHVCNTTERHRHPS
jgi:glycerol kinase